MSFELPAQDDLDAAKRFSDTVALHLAAASDVGDVVDKFVAIRLSDGGSDGELYETREEAISHQLHEYQCAYLCITPDGINVSDALKWLKLHRNLYDNGMRLSDPQAIVNPHVFKPGGEQRDGIYRYLN